MTFHDVLVKQLEDQLRYQLNLETQSYKAADILRHIVLQAVAMGYLKPVNIENLKFSYDNIREPNIFPANKYTSETIYNLKEIEYPTEKQILRKMRTIANEN